MRDLAYFARLLLRRWPMMLLGAALMLLTLLANIGLLALAGWFITASAVAGLGVAGAASMELFRPSAGIRFFAVTRTVSRYLERLATHDATFRILAELRVWAFERALPLDLGTLTRLHSGDMLNRVTADVDALDNLYLRVLAPTVVAAIVALGALGALSVIDPTLALSTLVLLALGGLGVPAAAGRLGRHTGESMSQLWADLRVTALDTVQGMADLAQFGAAERYIAAVAAETRSYHKLQQRMAHLTGLSNAATGFLGNLALWLVLFLGAGYLAAGNLDGAVLVMAGLGVLALYEAVSPLPLAYQYLGRTRHAAARLRRFAETQPAIVDPPEPAPMPNDTTLDFAAASLAYPGQSAPALADLELTVPPGSRLAVSGPSGAGKSSLAALVLRLRDPSGGSVRLGGTDLRKLRQADLHSQLGYLSQDAHIFSGTIRENLQIGDSQADEATLWGALRQAGLADFVAQRAGGLDAVTGEGGALVSGGQARRLALARVILKDAPILLLDEPTEGLDSATEADVVAALDRLAADKTLIVISHKEAPLSLAQRRLHLVDGRPADAPAA